MLKINIFIMIFVMSIVSYCYADDEFDIRKVKWGMSEQEVINSELPNNPFRKIDNIIGYKDKVEDKEATIAYVFSDNKLNQVIYSFENFDSQNDEDLFKSKIIKMLEDKYKSEEENPLLKGLMRQFYNENTSILLMTKKNEIVIQFEKKG